MGFGCFFLVFWRTCWFGVRLFWRLMVNNSTVNQVEGEVRKGKVLVWCLCSCFLVFSVRFWVVCVIFRWFLYLLIVLSAF